MKKEIHLTHLDIRVMAALLFSVFLLLFSQPTVAQQGPVKNIVIVHGALADGSGF